MPFFTCIYPHSISRRIAWDSSRSNISSGWIGTRIAACPAARTSSGRVRLLVVVCVIVNNVRKCAWIFGYPKKESKYWKSNAGNIIKSRKKDHNIYLSQRIIDSGYQTEKSKPVLLSPINYDFSVLLRAGSNPADSNRFLLHTGKLITMPTEFSLFIFLFILFIIEI